MATTPAPQTKSNKPLSIGGLYTNTSQKNGQKYLSGFITLDGKKHDIIIFKNEYKEQDTHPDLKIYLRTPKPGAAPANVPVKAAAPKSQPKPVPVVEEVPMEEVPEIPATSGADDDLF